MVFVSTPETAAWIQLPEPRMSLEYLFRTVRFEHNLRVLDRVSLGDIYLEVNVNSSKAELTELESERFKFTESLGAGVDVGLFSETVVPALGVKLHRDPVISGVTRNLFRAYAIYIFHRIFSPVAPFIGQAKCLPRATKKEWLVV